MTAIAASASARRRAGVPRTNSAAQAIPSPTNGPGDGGTFPDVWLEVIEGAGLFADEERATEVAEALLPVLTLIRSFNGPVRAGTVVRGV